MSDLVGIHNALAAQTITLTNGREVPAWALDEVKNSVISDRLPIRLLLPPGAEGGSAVEGFEMVSFKNAQVVWRVVDLLLYQTIGKAGGVANVWEVLTDYVAQYVRYFSTHRKLTPSATITGFAPQAGVFQWPRGSENQYHGVLMAVLVSETIC
jgi:hypothetical protein